jgi:hypothetical protein
MDRLDQKTLEETEVFYHFPVGACEAKIVSAEEKFSRTGKEMLEIVFENDEGARISYYIVEGDYFYRNLKALYTAFRIPLGEKNLKRWIGYRGVVITKLGEPYNGVAYPKVSHVRSIKEKEYDTESTPSKSEDSPF